MLTMQVEADCRRHEAIARPLSPKAVVSAPLPKRPPEFTAWVRITASRRLPSLNPWRETLSRCVPFRSGSAGRRHRPRHRPSRECDNVVIQQVKAHDSAIAR